MSDDPSFDDVMRLARKWHYTEIRSIVDEAIKECNAEHGKMGPNVGTEDERREWMDTWLHDTIDGHSHVIYTAQAGVVLAASDNDEAWGEATTEAPDVSGRAYHAMMADCRELLEARSDEWLPGDEDASEGDAS